MNFIKNAIKKELNELKNMCKDIYKHTYPNFTELGKCTLFYPLFLVIVLTCIIVCILMFLIDMFVYFIIENQKFSFIKKTAFGIANLFVIEPSENKEEN